MNNLRDYPIRAAYNSRQPAKPDNGAARSAAKRSINWLALGAIVGPIEFTLAWLVLGIISPGFTIWGTTDFMGKCTIAPQGRTRHGRSEES